MKVLVTGANGLIGANLVRELIKQGYKVRAFVRPTSDLRSLDGLNVEIATGDILEKESIVRAAKGCNTLFHLAAIFSYSKADTEKLIAIAKKGTINTIEAAKKAGVKKIVLTSSSVIFGSHIEPISLDENNIIEKPEPIPYITSKVIQEQVAFKHAEEVGVDMVAVCPTICVGPHDYSLSESNAIIINYLNDPFKATWPGGCNIVSVHDVARGHLIAAQYGQPGHRYLLGSQNLHWRAIHRIISEMCGIEGPLMTTTHTSSYLAAAFHEIISLFTNKRPMATRVQAKMVGRYYWYRHNRAASIGYSPAPARQAIANALSWLVKSDHVSASLRNTITLSHEVYNQRG